MTFLGKEGSLWMGDIVEYMTEEFLKGAFQAMGETVLSVKHIRNKHTGQNAAFCFVHFEDNETAMRVMHKLNGKIIPYTQPPTRFVLNPSNAGKLGKEQSYSLWVGDLDKSVDDSQLLKAFSSRYSSVRTAVVVNDKTTGISRGYAFVRFGEEEEQKDALIFMNGYLGLANKPIRVGSAVPRKLHNRCETATTADPAAAAGGDDYSAYYEQMAAWQNYHAWQNYGAYDGSGYQAQGYQGYDPSTQAAPAVAAPAAAAIGVAAPAAVINTVPAPVPSYAPAPAPSFAPVPAPVHAPAPTPAPAAAASLPAVVETQSDDDDQVVEHDVDLEEQNQEFVCRTEEFWDALDASRWLPSDTLNPALELLIGT